MNNDQISAKEKLQLALGTEWPASVVAQNNGSSVMLSRPSIGDRIPGILMEGHGPAVLVIDPKGASAAQQRPKVQDFIKQKRRVLLIDVFQTASAVAPRNRSHNHFLTFNLSDDACRVQDILTAIAFLQKSQTRPVELVGLGDAAVWSYFAAAVAPATVDLHADISSFNGSDEEFLHLLDVPGIQRAGGLAAAKLALAESK